MKRPSPASWLISLAVVGLIPVVIGLATAERTSTERDRDRPLAERHQPPQLDARTAPSLPTAIQDASSAELGGGVALLGGLDAAGTSTASVLRLAAGRATQLGNLPTPLHDAAAVMLGGAVYLFGGGQSVSEAGIFRVDPGSGRTAAAGQLPQPRSDIGAATVGDTAYIVGGYTGSSPLATILAWTPSKGAHIVGRLPYPLRYAAVTAADGRIVIAGGMTPSGPTSRVLAFDPRSGDTQNLGTLQQPLSHASAAELHGYVYVIGGRDATGSPLKALSVVDPRAGTIGPAGSLPAPLSDASAVGLGRTILVAGGRNASGATAQTLELLPKAVGPTSLLRRGSDPSVLPGNVLIADKANNRLLEITPTGKVVWSFPRRGDLAKGQTFKVPDDAFFTSDGRQVVATEEDDFVISVIDVAKHRIVYRYGHPGAPGAGPDYVYNPDDAIMLHDGTIVAADIKNCRLIEIRPPAHSLTRQLGATGGCVHQPPTDFSSPNGAFPLSDGGTVVTEIGGVWADVFNRAGKLTSAVNLPGFNYPSDTNEVRPGVFLSVDYESPGSIMEFDANGRVLWRFSPRGPDALNHPSLALPLPNGDVLANDDSNDRVIVVDPHINRIVWQYGHTGVTGARPGYLNTPDGVDLAPPYALTDRFPGSAGLPGG